MPFGLRTRLGPRIRFSRGSRSPVRTRNFEEEAAHFKIGTLCRELCKIDWSYRDAVRDLDSGGPKEACINGDAHWRHLVNATELSMCGGDAACRQITLTTCLLLLPANFKAKYQSGPFLPCPWSPDSPTTSSIYTSTGAIKRACVTKDHRTMALRCTSFVIACPARMRLVFVQGGAELECGWFSAKPWVPTRVDYRRMHRLTSTSTDSYISCIAVLVSFRCYLRRGLCNRRCTSVCLFVC